MTSLERITSSIDKLKISQIVIIGLILRLLATFFSKGYGFSDDHFETVELAWQLQNHIPAWQPGEIYLFNMFYIYIHLAIFQLCDYLHLPAPEFKMFMVRLFHAIVSVPFIWLGYKMVAKIASDRSAKLVALALALFWIFPFMSVRSLREFICITPLFIAFYHLENTQLSTKNLIWAAVGFGIAFIFRLQIVFFPIGAGIYLLTQYKWKETLLLASFTIAFLMLTQGVFEYFYWGNPFASLVAYVEYNATNSGSYPNGPWYMFIFTILGLAIPPISLFLMSGYFKAFKKFPIMFWGSLAFIVFHSLFPNKQERFILPFFPVFIVLGIVGIEQFINEAKFKIFTNAWFRISLAISLVINIVALSVLTFTYTKKSRCEAMSWFYDHKAEAIIFANAGGSPSSPKFYGNQNFLSYELKSEADVEPLKTQIQSTGKRPTYIVVTSETELEKTMANISKIYPNIVEMASFTPSFVDMIAYYLNPKHNVNETWTIYRIE
ncbi:MAG: glycosyltransferase family 39 protein [Cytophagales bacterium]